MEGFIGQIILFGGNFAVRGWAFCEGQLLPISQNQALFSILGTTYGGDGRTTFALPDLRGRFPMQQGTGPGLSPVNLGQKGGRASITEVPAHTHTLSGETGAGNQSDPTGNMLGASSIYAAPNANANRAMAADSIGSTGTSEVSVQNPFLGLNFLICLEGTFPSRS